MIINGLEFKEITSACPEQYDIYKDNEIVGSVRLRWGKLTAYFPEIDGELVYSHQFSDNYQGCFSCDEDRKHYLEEISKKINNCIENTHLSISKNDKILSAIINFKLPKDFDGDVEDALLEYLKYRKTLRKKPNINREILDNGDVNITIADVWDQFIDGLEKGFRSTRSTTINEWDGDNWRCIDDDTK